MPLVSFDSGGPRLAIEGLGRTRLHPALELCGASGRGLSRKRISGFGLLIQELRPVAVAALPLARCGTPKLRHRQARPAAVED
jgi:hypothetical protein